VQRLKAAKLNTKYMMLKKLWSKATKKNKGRNAKTNEATGTSRENKDDTRITDASALALAVVDILATNGNQNHDSIEAMQLARAVLDTRIFEQQQIQQQQQQQKKMNSKRSKQQLLSSQSLHGRIRSSKMALPLSYAFPHNDIDGAGTIDNKRSDRDAFPSRSLHMPSQSLHGALRQSTYSNSSNSAATPHQRGVKSSKQVQQQQRLDLMALLQQKEHEENIKLIQRGRRRSDRDRDCEAIQGGSVPTKPASQPLPASYVVLQRQSHPPAFPQQCENKKHSRRRRSVDGDLTSARSAGLPSQSLLGALPRRRGSTSAIGSGPHARGGLGAHSYHGHGARTSWALYKARAARGEVMVGSRQQISELLIHDGNGAASFLQDAAASRAAASEAITRMVIIPQNENDSKRKDTYSPRYFEASPALSHCQTSDGRQEIATLIIGVAEKLEEDRRAVMVKENGHGGQSQGGESSQESSLHENSYHPSMFMLRHCDSGDDQHE
jgi:hypothetical protein